MRGPSDCTDPFGVHGHPEPVEGARAFLSRGCPPLECAVILSLSKEQSASAFALFHLDRTPNVAFKTWHARPGRE